MPFFSETVAAKLAGREVSAELLCFMDFRDTPRRWWMGFGDVVLGGHTWQGLGELIAIEGLEQSVGTTANKTTFRLSGVDATVVQMARQSSDRVKDRRVQVFVQFWDVTDWLPLDQPYALWSGRMDQMTYAADGPQSRTVTVTAETIWAGRRKAPFGYYTDRDQNQRFPGDRGLEQVSSLVNKTIRWPVF